MWIESQHLSTARRRNVSPLGYQSPALGDSAPVPGLQDNHRVTLQPGVTISTLSRVPQLFTSIVSLVRTRREADNRPWVSHIVSGMLKGVKMGRIIYLFKICLLVSTCM